MSRGKRNPRPPTKAAFSFQEEAQPIPFIGRPGQPLHPYGALVFVPAASAVRLLGKGSVQQAHEQRRGIGRDRRREGTARPLGEPPRRGARRTTTPYGVRADAAWTAFGGTGGAGLAAASGSAL